MRPESLAKNTSRRTEAPPNACERHQKHHPVYACARMGSQGRPRRSPGVPKRFPGAPPGAAQARPRRSPGGAPAAKRPQALQALVSAAKQKPEAGVARRCQALLGAPSTPSSSWALPGAAQSLQGVTRRSLGAPMRVLGVPQALPGAAQVLPQRLQAFPNASGRSQAAGAAWRPPDVPGAPQRPPGAAKRC